MEINKARTELKGAKKNLLESYLNKIREYYGIANKRRRSSIIKDLERLVIKHKFDGEMAKKVRLDAGLTLRGLGSKIGVKHQYLYQIEIGDKRPPKKRGWKEISLVFERARLQSAQFITNLTLQQKAQR